MCVLALLAWDALRRFASANQWATHEEYEALHDFIDDAGVQAKARLDGMEERLPKLGWCEAMEDRVNRHGQVLTKLGLQAGALPRKPEVK